MKSKINKNEKLSTEHETQPAENVQLANQNTDLSSVFEQYEFKGWLITIESYYGRKELRGFATPKKYAHLINAENCYLMEEIAEENGIETMIDEDGDTYYVDYDYVLVEPDDIVVTFFEEIDTTDASCVLTYVVKKILESKQFHNAWGKKYDDIEVVVLKQIQKNQ